MRLLILTFLTIISCSSKEHKKIDFGKFSMTVPSDWNKYDRKGIDSYVGGIITNNKDTLNFDYGQYSGDASNCFPMVYDKETLAELSDKELKLLPKTKHLIVEDIFESKPNLREYLKYETHFELSLIHI